MASLAQPEAYSAAPSSYQESSARVAEYLPAVFPDPEPSRASRQASEPEA